MSKQILAAAVLSLVSAVAVAKDLKVTVNGNTKAGPIVNASEDTPVAYPGGTPPADIPGALDQDDSTFQRPGLSTANGGAYNGEPDCTGTDFPTQLTSKYDTVTITNTGAASAQISADILCGADDSAAYVYSTFNPAAPNTGCLLADDDSGSAAGGFCSLAAFAIPAGETRVLVVTAYQSTSSGGNDDFSYTVNFNGTTPVTLTNFSVD